MNENLYQAPSTPLSATGYAADGALPPGAVQSLLRTQVWARMVSVIGILVFILYMGIIIYLYSLTNRMSYRFPYESGMSGAAVFFNLSFCLTMIYPLLRLGKYASAIGRLRLTNSVADFQDALHQQWIFWRFVGVAVAVVTGLIPGLWIYGQLRH